MQPSTVRLQDENAELKRRIDELQSLVAFQSSRRNRCNHCERMAAEYRSCDSCDTINCTDCTQICEGCSLETCNGCSIECTRCIEHLCPNCASECDGCDNNYCDDCWETINLGPCIKCQATLCGECVGEHTRLEFTRWLLVYFVIGLECSNAALSRAIAFALAPRSEE